MIYRIHTYSLEMGSEGYEYHASRKAAESRRNELIRNGYKPDEIEIERRQTPKNKREVIALLNFWANHPDNG